MNIYDLLVKIIEVKPHYLNDSFFTNDYLKELDSDVDKDTYILLRNISSLGIKIEDKNILYYPKMMTNEKRTFSLDDMLDKDYNLLYGLDLDRIPLNLRTRLADILWTQKKNYNASKIAINGYYELFNLWFTNNNPIPSINMIKRAICISLQINDKKSFNKCSKKLLEKLSILDIKYNAIGILRTMDILIENKYDDLSVYIQIAGQLIRTHKEDVLIVEQSYAIIEKCYMALNKQKELNKSKELLADYYIDYSNELNNKGSNIIQVEYFINKAIKIYKDIGNTDKLNLTLKKLIDIQKKIPESLTTFSKEIDISDFHKKIDFLFKDLSVEEGIIKLMQYTPIYKKEKYKNDVIESAKNNPISYMVTKNLINNNGETSFVLPSLTLSDLSNEDRILDYHINQRIVKDTELIGDIYIRYVLKGFQSKFVIKNENLFFLTHDNPIIPEGRENIICSALAMILNGKYYEGMHILVPQFEHLFRCLSKELDAITIKFDDNGIIEEKVLGRIFELDEIKESYDPDILFLLKALLTEKSGANIRNKIAHGLVNESEACSGVYLYFTVLVMIIISFTSKKVS